MIEFWLGSEQTVFSIVNIFEGNTHSTEDRKYTERNSTTVLFSLSEILCALTSGDSVKGRASFQETCLGPGGEVGVVSEF